MGKTIGSMTEVAEVIDSPDLNVALPPSELVDALRWTSSFSPICLDGIRWRCKESGVRYTYVLKVLLIVISVESTIVGYRDVKSPARSVRGIRRCSWARGEIFLRVW